LGDALNLEVVALAEALAGGETRAAQALIDRSDDARAIVRLTEGARKEAPLSSRRVGQRLLVSPHTISVGLAGGVRVSLADHEAARRIMARLIAHHEAGQEEGMPAEALIAAGWPGERLLPDAAKNRLYVVIAWLRKQGLKDVLWRRFGGYLLDPDLLVVHTPD